ncbi:MAG: metallophosphoesterase [Mangrovibacterium sp.]
MRGIPASGVFLFLFVILLIELLAYLGIIQLVHEKKLKRQVSFLYWITSAAFLAIWLLAFLNPEKIRHTTNYQFFYFVISISVMNIFPKSLLTVFTIVAAPFRFLRKKFLSRVILLCGMIISLGMLTSIGYGIAVGRQIIRTEQVEIRLANLPKALDGLKIVQISDIHLGSFEDDAFLAKCTDEINRQQADLLLFTGDIVNNYYQEMLGFESQLKMMNAKYGKFAILGNHDYGDYSDWKNPADKTENQQNINKIMKESGFNLLLNQSERISLRDTSFYIIGVENWGHKPFPQYARLDDALQGVPENSFKILLSHDPSHWEGEVLNQTNIPLTLAGHTHGAQFGIRLAGIEFSPMYLIQKYWGGLYRHENQYLYVNRGIGCVGFLGRIDMAPEITVLTLRSE